ncbi:39410_t:CDS:2 [Gigaspora margarita]|uniref:39410_t:CDS:1 n=1 Tax=Gigaspora margarita TaxID=4874 RepID=A0ABN7UFY1_GIGMA|nr:39410_t:CDS:2 [Gigaspora margarita]
MNPTNNTRSTQILTNKIELDNKINTHISIEDHVAKRFRKHKIYAVSSQFDDTKKTVIKRLSCPNGFAAAIFHAYNYHKHLRLSPDDVWLTISQGVSQHINRNAEKFRNRFVKHEGKKELIIGPEIINEIVAAVDENVEKLDLRDLLECNFSTTTPNSLTASRIVLLDTVKSYFKYTCVTMCGIPKVTLEGTLEDWMKLQEKVANLRKLNLELDFWLDRLEPIIWNLVAIYRGEIDEDFWGRIVRIDKVFGSGGDSSTYISGWMINFFPYSGDHEVEVEDIPNGIVGVPFTLDGKKLKFIAGFIGANQEVLEDSDGESVVSPVIGWSVVDDNQEVLEDFDGESERALNWLNDFKEARQCNHNHTLKTKKNKIREVKNPM